MRERIYRVGVKTNKLFHAYKEHLEDFAEYVENYVTDGWHFFETGDYVSALAAFDYAYGLIEGYLKAKGITIPEELR
jgi:hypothetical protein